jgi:hypothetical protein
MPLNIKHAYTKKTRSFDGYPGPEYWQNRADYKIHVNLDPKNGILTGTEEILYFNNSPDSLAELIIHLFPNIYKKGNSREFNIDFTDASDGVALEEIRVNNKIVDIEPEDCFIKYLHNDIKLNLEEPLHSGQTITLNISWHYRININSHMRTGMVDSSSYFNAYFFPRIAVYDDIDGWNYHKYSGIAEFYNDFGGLTSLLRFFHQNREIMNKPTYSDLEKRLKELIEKIFSTVNQHFDDAPQNDDMTMIVFRRE